MLIIVRLQTSIRSPSSPLQENSADEVTAAFQNLRSRSQSLFKAFSELVEDDVRHPTNTPGVQSEALISAVRGMEKGLCTLERLVKDAA
jgi:hypothetical protein